MGTSASVLEQSSVHDFTVKDSTGKDVNLSIYKGKVLLIVNVASKCGLTNSNYTQLTEIYRKYKDRGFEILAFPCNQFLQQEPGTIEETVQFVCERFKAEYPIFAKVKVNGSNTEPLYKYLKANGGGLMGTTIKWNFTKFLINKKGEVIRRYGARIEPSSIEVDIEKALEEPEENQGK
ncbi:putative glutathione peroxidase [Helianthus annuus]|uniref:Glutathione peroxidase n=1 Tax=Helianthus annuus TaxID=4232 RepID=A0A251TFY7_HELAN|nr:probable glutathione peroxidase 4 [Helianthus annuus]KAF5785102.1 putative glutathione peroxidase [Helianthus annuus]KAJ0882486.1 putative glutathione peroxidase [Helianthus annuus]